MFVGLEPAGRLQGHQFPEKQWALHFFHAFSIDLSLHKSKILCLFNSQLGCIFYEEFLTMPTCIAPSVARSSGPAVTPTSSSFLSRLAGQVFVRVGGPQRVVTLSRHPYFFLPLNLTLCSSQGFPDYQLATVADVFYGLVRRGVLKSGHLGSCYLGYGGWRRTCPLPFASTLSDVQVQRQSTLTLYWRLRGGSRIGMKHYVHGCIGAILILCS